MSPARRIRLLADRVIEHYWSTADSREFVVFSSRNSALSLLVATILSQNTNDRNASRAYEELTKVAGDPLRPEALLRLGVEGIAKAIRSSGMQHVKARTIVNLVSSITTRELEELDPLELRARLLEVPGVGFKTVDVFLLMYRRYPVFPIDTHIRRILVRYGAASPRDDYERMRLRVESELPRDPEYLVKAHLSLIKHGRATCKARAPRCNRCPVLDSCARVGVITPGDLNHS